MADRIARESLARPWLLIGVVVAVLAASIALSIAAPSRLGVGSLAVSAGEPGPEFALVTRGTIPVSSRVYSVALDVISSRVRTDPAVSDVTKGPVSDDGRTTALLVALRPDDPGEQQRAAERIAGSIDPGPLHVTPAGTVPVAIAARHDLSGQIWKLELLALPLALLVLGAVLGLRVGGAAALCSATAVAGTLAGMRLAGGIATVSLVGLAPAAVVGIALGIELVALPSARFRDELQPAGRGDAMRRTVEHAARGGLLAVAAVLAATSGLLVTSLDQAGSIVFSCGLAAALAASSALLTAPAVAALDRAASGEAEPPLAGASRAIAGRLTRRRRTLIAACALGGVALVALASPALNGRSKPFSATDLPAGTATRTATEFVDSSPPAPATDPAAPGREAEEAAGTSGIPAAAPGREAEEAAGTLGVPGLFPELPAAAGVSLAALALLALVAFRSPRALIAVVPALLPAAAAAGLAVLVLQEGHLAGSIGQVAQHALETGALVSVLAAVAAIGAMRAITAVSLVRGERELGMSGERAGELGAGFSMPGVLAATLVTAAAAGVLAGGHLYAAREFGLAVAAGLLLDLMVVRLPLLGALARWGG